MAYVPNTRQKELLKVCGSGATHILAYGGSRSGKTLEILRIIVLRALAAPGSRHAVLRLRFNHCKQSIVLDTFPKMMQLCFPDVSYGMDKSDWYATMPNGSEIWFGGLDDKQRTEKILGKEFCTVFLNEISQLLFSSVMMVMTRLAQKAMYKLGGEERMLRRLMIYDCNPPPKSHWSYRLFFKKLDPESGKRLAKPDDYATIQLNPRDNAQNLAAGYLQTLEQMPARMRVRFLDGEFSDDLPGVLFSYERIDANRVDEVPEMVRIVVAVDPSGAGDEENAGNDEIGIVVAGLGTDGFGYVLEDLTCKVGPKTWGKIAVDAYHRWSADRIVAEMNYGGEMVRFVIKAAGNDIPFRKLTASRGKVVRAEPISALVENDKVKFQGQFEKMVEELTSMTTHGYVGSNSPNRADAFVWAMSDLFPHIAKNETEKAVRTEKVRKQARLMRVPWFPHAS